MKTQYLDVRKLIKDNTLTIIDSNNGLGKTYSMCKMLLEDFRNFRSRFVLITRYANQIAAYGNEIMSKYFDLIHPEMPIKYVTDQACGRFYYGDDPDDKNYNGEHMGYVVALSRAYKCKQILANLKVRYYVFDEYNAPTMEMVKGNGEFELFATLLNCATRDDDFQCILLGNSLNPTNVYKAEWNIPFHIKKWKDPVNKRAYYNIVDKTRAATRVETTFGKMFEGTSYIHKALENDYTNGSYVPATPNFKVLTRFEISGERYILGFDNVRPFIALTELEPQFTDKLEGDLPHLANILPKLRNMINTMGIECCKGVVSGVIEYLAGKTNGR